MMNPGLYKTRRYGIVKCLPRGNGHNRTKLQKDIEEFHIAYGLDFIDTLMLTFLSRRPDGSAFDIENKQYWLMIAFNTGNSNLVPLLEGLCVFLEFTKSI